MGRRLLPLLLLLTLPAVVQAQFNFTTNADDTITITGYTGPGVDVVIPSTTNGLLVTTIGDRAFYGWTRLTSVAIPDSVTSLGTSAFNQCSSLTNLNLGHGVTSIGVWCFQFCASLTNLAIPDSVTNIGDLAFAYCSSLTNVTIGSGLTSLGIQEFFFCTNLTAIVVDELNSSFASVGGVLFNKSQTTLVQYPGGKAGSYTISNSVISIADDAFQYCSALTDLTIPDTVTSIGDGVFYHCANLASPTLPSHLTHIGNWAFQYCDSLSAITIPSGVTNIGVGAFASCASLTATTVDALNPAYGGANGVLFNHSGSTLIQTPAGKTGSYAISNSVTSLGDEAFEGCRKLAGVTIPASVASIGSDAFYGCSGLTSLTLPNITSISIGAFNFCSALRSIVIPDSVTNIGNFAFASCANLAHVTLGNRITSIGTGAFMGCDMANVTIPSGVTNIGSSAFQGCTRLSGAYFQGNAPGADSSVFSSDSNAIVYYLPLTSGWGPNFGGRRTALWNPQVRTPDPNFGVRTNRFGFTIIGTSNLSIVVEACTNLANHSWSPVSTNTLTGGSSYFSDPQWTNHPVRLYRLRSP